jgi:DNA-binding CsgD family transcriptional regulator
MSNLANVLSQASFLEFRAGNISLAEKLAIEVCDIVYPAPGADLFLAAEELLWIAGTRGDQHQVEQLIATTLPEIDRIPPLMQIPFHAYAGYAELALGHHEAAVSHLLSAAGIAESVGMEDARGLGWQADLVEAQLLTGDLGGAAHTIQLLVDAVERSQSVIVEVDHLRTSGLLQLARGEVGDAVATLTHAVELAPRTQRPLAIARTLLALGSAQRRAGNRTKARETLEASRREFSHLEAAPWIERVDDELRRLGNRPSAESASNLTPTERQIAELVTQGRSNRQIAAELMISLRTVESNLTRVYRKLEVRGRTELAAGGRTLLDRVAS